MKDLRRRFERFCLKNRGKGIPNLMLVIAIGNLVVYVLSRVDPSNIVYSYLCFSRSAILRGQVWRLFTYVFTYLNDTAGIYLFLAVVSLFCYYQFGKILESYWGPFRFNLYYLTGLLLTDLAALLLGSGADAAALNLSLFLAVATIAPEARVLLLFFIPIKMKYMAWVYLGGTVLSVFLYLRIAPFLSFYWLLPIVPLLNYLLFFGSDVKNILPDALRYRQRKNYRTTGTPGRMRTGPGPTTPKPAKSPTATSARSAAGRTRTIRIWSSATARNATATTATASTTSTTTSISPRPRRGSNKKQKDVPSGTSFLPLFPAALDVQGVERLLSGGGQGHAAADRVVLIPRVVEALQRQGKIDGDEPLDLQGEDGRADLGPVAEI